MSTEDNTPNSTDETTPNSTRVEYTWSGAKAQAEEQTTYQFVHGGEQVLVHADFTSREDGTVSVSVLSTGPEDRQALSHLVSLLQSLVAQEALEYAQETSE